MGHPVFTGREVAARVIERVLANEAYAAAALDAELERPPSLSDRERALATEITYGTLRTYGALVRRLERHAKSGLPQSDSLLRAHLLCAAYQILLLDRVPGFAAVDAAVDLVKRVRGPRVAGFVNAVLRKLAGENESLRLEQAILESVPRWLFRKMAGAVGSAEAEALLGVTARGAPRDRFATTVRVVEHATWPEWLRRAERGRASPLGRVIRRGGDLRRRPGWKEGAFVVQEEGSQLVALAVGTRRGEKVLDACAGRGQKASLLAERAGNEGTLWAADLHQRKLEALGREFRRLGLPEPRTACVDWTAGVRDVPEGFDRVLVDAPCSGTGTLRRRPEITLRLAETDPGRLANLAERILRGAAERAKPGGRVVFAVCSVLPEECESQVARVSDVLEPVAFDSPDLGELAPGAATTVRLSVLEHGTDGYFIASFRRRA